MKKIGYSVAILMAVFCGGLIILSSCGKNENEMSYAGNFLFDQKELTLEHTESRTVVKILGVEGLEDYVVPKDEYAWGAASVRLFDSKENDIITEYRNTFEVINWDEHTNFNKYLNPFKGEFFSIENIDGDVHILLNENRDVERKLIIEINGGPHGHGEIFITQKGVE
ncbi:MAG: hypothetical protein LBE91_03820 [Tannerella sp.]|nr:hypothetical protein [Tannerella sp.]